MNGSHVPDAVYPIVYLDCIVVKTHQDKRVINKSIFLALGINLEGHKELMGIWIAENEGAKFWLNVLTELHQRGAEDILIVRVDGFDAINTVFPQTHIQLCIVHTVHNQLKYLNLKDNEAVTVDLKRVYRSATEDKALLELERFSDT